MPWRRTHVGSASSRRKRASNLGWQMLMSWPGKAAHPNSLQKIRPAGCRCWNSTMVHIFRSRSRFAGIWRGFILEPNLLGRDLREQAEIERWNRRMELELFAAIGRTVQHTSPIFQGRFKQFPEYGETQRALVYQCLERMDRELNGHKFVAGDRFTIADITALVAIDIGGRLAEIKIAPELAHLTRWHETVSSRPSARA